MKYLNITFIIILISIFFGCKKKEAQKNETIVTALYTVDKDAGESPLTVAFSNKSENPGYYAWDFGDGNVTTFLPLEFTYTFKNYSFTEDAKYTVTLTSMASSNVQPQYSKVITVYKKKKGTVTDFEGNVYPTVVIGNQTWMAENVRSTKYADGTDIAEVKSYNNDDANVSTYGRLYTWDGAMNYSTIVLSQGVCPDGWHIPESAELSELREFVENDSQIDKDAYLLKSKTGWDNNGNGIDMYGFNALPAGTFSPYGNFGGMGFMSSWWSSVSLGTNAEFIGMNENSDMVNSYSIDKKYYLSVRCVKND